MTDTTTPMTPAGPTRACRRAAMSLLIGLALLFSTAVANAASDCGTDSDRIVIICLGESWHGRCGAVTTEGKVIIPFTMDDIRFACDGRIPFSEKGRWGFADFTGAIVIPPRFSQATNFSRGIALAVEADSGLLGIIDHAGNSPTGFKFDANSFQGTWQHWCCGKYVHLVLPTGQHVCADRSGKFLIKPNDDRMHCNDEVWEIYRRKPGTEDFLHGLMSTDGKVVLEPQYDSIFVGGLVYGSDGSGVAQVEKDGLWGLVDFSGRVIVPYQFQGMDFAGAGYGEDSRLVGVVMPGPEKRQGAIDLTGKMVIQPIYQRISWLPGGFAVFKRDGRFGVMDKSGREIVPPTYVRTGPPSSGGGLLAVTTGDAISGPWGAIDMTGKMVIPEQFGDHFQFSDGLAAVAEAAVRPKLHGYTDRNGKLVLPFQFETAMPFRNGVAWAKKDKRWQIIDKTGKVLFQE
jgi:hypothetical protein